MHHITTEQIETFLTLAQKKNYREVSEMLFITQPTVTKHIQRLEKELGVLLFKRTKQSVELTEAGSYLAGTWFPIYRQFLESITEVQQSTSVRKNQLTISILRDYHGLITPDTLTAGFEDYLSERGLTPIHLSFRFLSMREQREALQNHHIDFSFSLGFDYDSLRSVQSEDLIWRPLFALMPSSHRLADREEVSLQELADETFLVLSPTESFRANSVTTSMLYRYFKNPKTRIMANLQSIAYALTQGDGITLGNRCFLGDSSEADIVEVPVTEMQNDRYEETVAYTTEDMSTMKELFLDYVLRKYKKHIRLAPSGHFNTHSGCTIESVPYYDRTEAYWTGFTLTWYQWYDNCTFRELFAEVPCSSIAGMYPKYHEMDLMHSADEIRRLRRLSAYRNRSCLADALHCAPDDCMPPNL